MGKLQIENTDVNVMISREVVAGIAINAAKETDGIANVTGKFAASDIKAMFAKKNLGNGVKIDYLDDGIVIDMFIVVEFGISIPKTANELQLNVKQAVSTMTGINVLAVNVNVVGITLAKDAKFKQQ
ncbi:MAG: Asp23/Gls24 family envelope stress response protein [Clostridia bacterium]|nr:Asp23/Gls24 family envelope stress response protein [Clostridia bacterium]